MKILYVISNYPPAWSTGGAARSAFNITKRFAEQGHDVTVFTTDLKKREERITPGRTIKSGVEVIYFRNLSNSLAWHNVPTPVGIVPALSQSLSDFDIVHSDLCRSIEVVPVWYYCQKHDVPYFIQPRGAAPRLSKQFSKKVFDRTIGNRYFQDSSEIIASSKSEMKQILRIYKEIEAGKIVKIPNGLQFPISDPLPDKGSFRERYSIDESTDLVLYLGRIHERKGLLNLIAAFEQLQQSRADTKLAIVGPNEGYRNVLEEAASARGLSDTVCFTGPLYEEEKAAAYIDSDVFVLPSDDAYESFGNVVIESLSCGTPIVVTRNCGVSEYIDDEWGVVADASMPELSEAINQVLSSDIRIDSEDIQTVRERFSWEQMVDQLVTEYSEYMSN